MSEETTNVVEKNESSAVDPVITRATEQGWKPKEEFAGDAGTWVPADEFLRRGELFGKIKDLKSEIHSRDQRHTEELKLIQKELMAVRKSSLEQAKRELQAQLDNTEDKTEAIRLTKEVAKVEADIAEVKAPPAQPVVNPPEVQTWLSDNNSWYNKDSDMTLDADSAAAVYVAKNPGASPKDVLVAVDKQMKRLYPDKFGEKKVSTPPSPESGIKKVVPPTGKKTRNDLPEEHRRVMEVFIKRGITTEKQYLADYFGE